MWQKLIAWLENDGLNHDREEPEDYSDDVERFLDEVEERSPDTLRWMMFER